MRMKRAFLSLNLVFAWSAIAAVNIPLTIQEAIYPGSMSGLSRVSEPVTVGMPLPDDPASGVTDVSQLSLSGTTAGQFRVLGRWPSGRIKWVLVDTLVDVSAGQKNTGVALTSGGTGNFGGANLATDNGTTITVVTGAATFTIRKANFNGIDQAVVAGTTVVASGTSQGLVVLGPDPNAAYPGNVTRAPTTGGTACTTIYSSANDPASTCIIEENGPVKSVLKCTGSHIDSAKHAYMRFTARLYFTRGKTSVRMVPILRNADYGTSNTFATAFKGYQGYELRISPNITGTLNYAVAAPGSGTGCSGGVCSGTLNQAGGTDYVYLYQAESNLMKDSNWCTGNTGCVAPATLSGYALLKNGVAVTTGDGFPISARLGRYP